MSLNAFYGILVLRVGIFQDVKVVHTFLEYIDNMAFRGNWNLESIAIAHTRLTTMPPLNPVKRNLQYLFLFHNSISFVPSLYFKGFYSLKHLDLRSNSLQIFPDVTSLSCTLVQLAFSYNCIETIPHTFYMTKFSHLEKLLLYSNHIPTFDYGTISSWPNLNHLDLAKNDITNLPDIQNQYNNCSTILRTKCSVLLYKNPINCNGTSFATVSHIIQHRKNPTIINCHMLIYPKYIRCASPPHLYGRVIRNLSE